jgi:hypothetical protein
MLLRKLNDHQFHLLLFRIAIAIKNQIYLFLPLQISLGMVFTLEVRNFQFNEVQVPVHIFLIPHAMEIHIPPIPKWSELDSMASRQNHSHLHPHLCFCQQTRQNHI